MKFDIIGDIHGCFEELVSLLSSLGYEKKYHYAHPEGRKVAFVGDLTDRGPNSLQVITLVSTLVENGTAYYVRGNHCDKLYRYFIGRNVQISHGLETTIDELAKLNKEDYQKMRDTFIHLVEQSPYYHVLDNGQLIVAHAGIRSEDIGTTNNRVKAFTLYGDISGETNPDGTPVRLDWAQHHHAQEWIIYGHTPVMKPRFVNRSVNIDTGCVFGGALSALRYPEMNIIQVPSLQPFVKNKFHFCEE